MQVSSECNHRHFGRFFQSLYHNRSSGLRRLHNTADSIIIFDEIHLLPINLLQPCLRGVGYITKYLNSEAIFLSATMPDYTELFRRFLPDCRTHELLPDTADFCYFQKCCYIDLGKTDFDSILHKAAEHASSLIIVNRKSTAREVYNMLQGEKYHLSTYMTPADRSDTIRAIRSALSEGREFTVVSTSLIEAGVDLDFEAVFRQYAGLDSILQAGGRCNREGKRASGNVYIFEIDEPLNRDLQIPVEIVKNLLAQYDDKLLENGAGGSVPDGWGEQDIHFRIMLTEEGNISSIVAVLLFSLSSRPTRACELKWAILGLSRVPTGHAPRGRVS